MYSLPLNCVLKNSYKMISFMLCAFCYKKIKSPKKLKTRKDGVDLKEKQNL